MLSSRNVGGGSPGKLRQSLGNSATCGISSQRYQGWLCAPFIQTATPAKPPDTLPNWQPGGSGPAGQTTTPEESYRTRVIPDGPRILQPALCSTKGFWRFPTCHRPVDPEQISDSSQIPDGDAQVDPIGPGGQSVGGQVGPFGCIFSCSDTSSSSTVPPVYVQRPSVAVPSLTFRPCHSAFRVHLDPSPPSDSVTSSRHPHPRFSGRLAGPPFVPVHTPTTHSDGTGFGDSSRLPDQPREIDPDPTTNLSLSGDGVRLDQPISTPSYGQVRTTDLHDSRVPNEAADASHIMGPALGQARIHRVACSPWTSSITTSSVSSKIVLGLQLGSQTTTHSDDPSRGRHVEVVDFARSPSRGSTSAVSTLNRHTLYGCQSTVRMGSPSRWSNSWRSMGGCSHRSHQSVGDESSPVCFTCLCRSPPQQKHSDCFRQHNSTGLSPQSRWNEKSRTNFVDFQSFSVRGQHQSDLYLPPRSREEERVGRSSFATGSSHTNGVDASPKDTADDLDPVVTATDRRVCNMPDSSASEILLSRSRSSCGSSRCPITGLDSTQPIYVSSFSADSGHSAEVTEASCPGGSGDSLDSSRRVVSRSARPKSTARVSKDAAPSSHRPAKSTSIRRAIPTHTDAQSTRLLAATAAIRHQGFSAPVARIATCSTSEGSRRVYDSRWHVFTKWCSRQSPPIVPERSTAVRLAEFFRYLGEERCLKPATIKGYRAAIASVFRPGGMGTVTQHPVLSNMMAAFDREIPAQTTQLPKWNLQLVLHYLNKPDYEPLRKASLKHLTWKTAFLVILGSGCRRSELHALDFSRLEHDSHWSWVNLLPSPGWRAKYQFKDPDPNRSRVYRLHSLPASDTEDRHSCPVRALRLYLKATADRRTRHNNSLFLPISGSTKKLSANTISSWIKSVVTQAYAQATPDDLRLFQIPPGEPDLFRSAHELRALGTSLSWSTTNSSLHDIMRACYWRSHTVFTSHYLRLVSTQTTDGLRHLASHSLPGATAPT